MSEILTGAGRATARNPTGANPFEADLPTQPWVLALLTWTKLADFPYMMTSPALSQQSLGKAYSYDSASSETVNGYYKAELIYGPARPGPWRTVEDVELATLGWVHWHNTIRPHGCLGDMPPAEFEAASYATKRTGQPLAGIQWPESLSNPGRFSQTQTVSPASGSEPVKSKLLP